MNCKFCGVEVLPSRKFCSKSHANSFNNKLHIKRKLKGKCKECQSPIRTSQTWCSVECKSLSRIRTKSKRIKLATRRVAEWRREQKIKVVEFLGGKCSRCGYDKCIAALDAHHIDPSIKSFALSDKGLTKSWDKVKQEASKCILLCANCHREEHYNGRNIQIQ